MSAGYIFREGLQGFRRAKIAAAGSILTIIISLLFLGLFYLLSINTARIMSELRGRVEMEVFLDEPNSAQTVKDLQQQIQSLEGVDHIQFISKEEAAKIFRHEFGEDINSVLDFNPLPPSFKIYLREAYRTTARADDIQKKISAMRGIDKVVYRRDLLEFVEKQSQTLNIFGFAVGLLISLSGIFLVSNTIRLMIHNKRKTIYAMKLAGASRWFVRAPFLLEGCLQGAVAGSIAAGMMYYLITVAHGQISQELFEFVRTDLSLYVYMIFGGIALGTLGSSVAVHKYIQDTIG
jgi:cell division transport system permease protein